MNTQAKLNPNRLRIFHEIRKRRIFVGELSYDLKKDKYILIYDKVYAYAKNAIPISPKLDLFKLRHESKGKLFSALQDRIPEKENPAYPDYCASQDISVDEKNPIILLGTIGKRGPSSFVFEAVYETEFNAEDIIKFREELQITQHDFAQAFAINKTSLQRIESNASQDKNSLKLIEIFLNFPDVALWQLKQTGHQIHSNVLTKLINYFEKLKST